MAMLITILTAGSQGDTQPYVALGIELKKAGHTVRIAASEGFKEFIAPYGLDFFPMKGDVAELASSDVARKAMQADNPLKFFLSFNDKTLQSFMADMQKDFYTACIGSDAIVYHPGAAIGYSIAQHLNIPGILATPFPMTPTRDYPALLFYDSVRLGRQFNAMTHRLFVNGFWLALRSSIRQFWKQELGSVPGGLVCPFNRQNTRRFPTVTSCSNHVFPRPSDWPEHVYNTGYWFLEDEAGWQPPQDLVEFLEQGEPPVYIGFGSVGSVDSAMQTTALMIKALTLSGRRGVLATGWNGMSNVDNLPDGIFMLDHAPHSWLFPRMAAVVHHGGAGTTHAGLRAGVPSIIIPFGNDQFAWGRRVYELGVGSRAIPRKRLTAENLAAALEYAGTEEIKQAATDLGRKIREECGAANAAAIIMRCLAT
jgi:sterol 3beta-glucosyltransferase